jgi:hypothetical protein
MGIAGYVSVWVQLYCVGFHCFTTCFGLHGHLQVCRIFIFICLKDSALLLFSAFFSCGHPLHVFHLCCKQQADKHTCKETTKNNGGKQHRKNTNGKHTEGDHVKKGSEPKKQ